VPSQGTLLAKLDKDTRRQARNQRAVLLAGHRFMDQLAEQDARMVASIVTRHATLGPDGFPVLTEQGSRRAMAEVGLYLASRDGSYADIVVGTATAEANLGLGEAPGTEG